MFEKLSASLPDEALESALSRLIVDDVYTIPPFCEAGSTTATTEQEQSAEKLADRTTEATVTTRLASIEQRRITTLHREQERINAAKDAARYGIYLTVEDTYKHIKSAIKQRTKEIAVLDWHEKVLRDQLEALNGNHV